MCGHTCHENRPHKGLLFVCQVCHYTLHADLVGARNITLENAADPARLDEYGAFVSTPLMYRAMKPKQHVCKDMLSCGGVQTQATPIYRQWYPTNYSRRFFLKSQIFSQPETYTLPQKL